MFRLGRKKAVQTADDIMIQQLEKLFQEKFPPEKRQAVLKALKGD